MALIEYYIKYDDKNKTAKVTYKILGVEKGDRISFASNYKETGIQYQKRSPFSGGPGPQADEVFEVGKHVGPFQVSTPSDGKPFHADCGEVEVAVGTTPDGNKRREVKKLKKAKGSGLDTP